MTKKPRPCRYCGDPVLPDQGVLEKNGSISYKYCDEFCQSLWARRPESKAKVHRSFNWNQGKSDSRYHGRLMD